MCSKSPVSVSKSQSWDLNISRIQRDNSCFFSYLFIWSLMSPNFLLERCPYLCVHTCMHHLKYQKLVLGESFINDTVVKYIEILDYDNFFLFPWEEIPENPEADGKEKGGAAS